MTVLSGNEIYYDPYDFEIDTDPYPLWKRMRDEAPLWWNEKHEFWALSRWEDVDPCLGDWETYSSGKGSILELIKANIEMPSGIFLFEDPPIHDIHRSALVRLFTPRKINALESQIREFCALTLDPLVGTGGFDFIRDLAAPMPMRVMGYLLGIPEDAQEAIRARGDAGMNLNEDGTSNVSVDYGGGAEMFADFVDFRTKNPSDDLMTELINADVDSEDGGKRKLGRDEILMYLTLLAGAGNETTTRLIGWTGKVLAEHPDQRAEIVADPGLVPNAIEELLRFEAPSPVQARLLKADVEHHGQTLKEGQIVLLLNGSANRDERVFEKGDTFDIHRRIKRHLSFGYGLHFCMGAALARLEGRIALEETIKRFPEWEIDWDNAKQARTSTVRGWEALPVKTP